jgi:hypothetical protein
MPRTSGRRPLDPGQLSHHCIPVAPGPVAVRTVASLSRVRVDQIDSDSRSPALQTRRRPSPPSAAGNPTFFLSSERCHHHPSAVERHCGETRGETLLPRAQGVSPPAPPHLRETPAEKTAPLKSHGRSASGAPRSDSEAPSDIVSQISLLRIDDGAARAVAGGAQTASRRPRLAPSSTLGAGPWRGVEGGAMIGVA